MVFWIGLYYKDYMGWKNFQDQLLVVHRFIVDMCPNSKQGNKSNSEAHENKRKLKSIRLKQKQTATAASCSLKIPAAPTDKLANYLSNVLTMVSLDSWAGPGAVAICRQEVKGGMGATSAGGTDTRGTRIWNIYLNKILPRVNHIRPIRHWWVVSWARGWWNMDPEWWRKNWCGPSPFLGFL